MRKCFHYKKITPKTILPLKNLTWESRNGEGRGCLQIRVQTFWGRISGPSENSLKSREGGGSKIKLNEPFLWGWKTRKDKNFEELWACRYFYGQIVWDWEVIVMSDSWVCHYYKLTKHSGENKVTFSDKHPGPGFVPRTRLLVSKPSLKQHIRMKSWTFQLVMQLIASGNWFIIKCEERNDPFYYGEVKYIIVWGYH